MKHFATNEQRAAAYTAHNLLGRMLKADGELPPGYNLDVSGMRVEITIPPNTQVDRSAGDNGDGTQRKKATQNTYGFGPLFLVWELARKFNQHKRFERLYFLLVRRAVRRGLTSEKAMQTQISKVRWEQFLDFREGFKLPSREERTPRKIVQAASLLPTLGFFRKGRKRAA